MEDRNITYHSIDLEANPVEDIEKYACKICGAHASGFHFNAQSCSACAAAFRRNVALKKNFQCVNGKNECKISFKQTKNCRACRIKKCIEAGMETSAVKAGQQNSKIGRNYFTISGLKRNKRFGQSLGIDLKYLESFDKYKHQKNAKNDKKILDNEERYKENNFINTFSSIKKNINNLYGEESQMGPNIRKSSLYFSDKLFKLKRDVNVLEYLIEEEKRINERRRILFCEKPVSSLFGLYSKGPFTKDDIKPLNFRQFTKSIRIHILFIYEWMRGWEFFSHLSFIDQTTFLRKCVLYHTVLDPSFISCQIGDMTKFVLPNGGFVSTISSDSSGWGDEKHITGANKKYIYWPLLQRVKSEIMQSMIDMEITHDEFCALKAIASLEGSKNDVSQEGKAAMQRESENLTILLLDYYIKIGKTKIQGAERIGNLYLLLSTIFDISDNFVESHHQVHFFDIWKLDDLLLQFLKKKT
uniref:Nuclear receptor domain-containing protein n=1 Tax=Strongyloides stercoralis TaxID=6248 RepID=A0A0K0E1A8_STRER